MTLQTKPLTSALKPSRQQKERLQRPINPGRAWRSVFPVAITLLALNIDAARAQTDGETSQAAQDERGTWSFVWENDYFAQTDQNYTNGVRIAYFTGPKQPRGFADVIAQNVLRAGDDAVIRRGFALGHSIFTPRDTDVTAPLSDQHPYAAWLYAEYSAAIERDDTVDQLTIQAGVVGPSAGGEFVQNNWHSLIGVDPALGWDNQIDDEFGVVLSYDRKLRDRLIVDKPAVMADITPSFGASLGNIRTHARLGITLRIGPDLPSDYGPPRVRPSLAGSGYFSPRRPFGWYVFFGAEARAVAHDIFLDGSLFRDNDPSVTSKTLVGDFQTGLVAQFRSVQIAYTYIVRTREFEEQLDRHRFGAVSLSVKF